MFLQNRVYSFNHVGEFIKDILFPCPIHSLQVDYPTKSLRIFKPSLKTLECNNSLGMVTFVLDFLFEFLSCRRVKEKWSQASNTEIRNQKVENDKSTSKCFSLLYSLRSIFYNFHFVRYKLRLRLRLYIYTRLEFSWIKLIHKATIYYTTHHFMHTNAMNQGIKSSSFETTMPSAFN